MIDFLLDPVAVRLLPNAINYISAYQNHLTQHHGFSKKDNVPFMLDCLEGRVGAYIALGKHQEALADCVFVINQLQTILYGDVGQPMMMAPQQRSDMVRLLLLWLPYW